MPSATTNDQSNGDSNGHPNGTNGFLGPSLELKVLGLNSGTSMVSWDTYVPL